MATIICPKCSTPDYRIRLTKGTRIADIACGQCGHVGMKRGTWSEGQQRHIIVPTVKAGTKKYNTCAICAHRFKTEPETHDITLVLRGHAVRNDASTWHHHPIKLDIKPDELICWRHGREINPWAFMHSDPEVTYWLAEVF